MHQARQKQELLASSLRKIAARNPSCFCQLQLSNHLPEMCTPTASTQAMRLQVNGKVNGDHAEAPSSQQHIEGPQLLEFIRKRRSVYPKDFSGEPVSRCPQDTEQCCRDPLVARGFMANGSSYSPVICQRVQQPHQLLRGDYIKAWLPSCSSAVTSTVFHAKHNQI